MNRYLTTVVLALALSMSAFAGEIPSVPGPPPTPAAPSANVEGDMGAGGFTEQITDEIVLAIFGIFAA